MIKNLLEKQLRDKWLADKMLKKLPSLKMGCIFLLLSKTLKIIIIATIKTKTLDKKIIKFLKCRVNLLFIKKKKIWDKVKTNKLQKFKVNKLQKMKIKFLKILKTMKEFQKVLKSQTTKQKLNISIKLFQWNNIIVVKMLQGMITLLEYILNLSKKEFKAVKHISINFTKIKDCLRTKMQTKWINIIALKTMSSQNFKKTPSTKSNPMITILLNVCITINKLQLLLLCLQEFQTATARTCRVLK